MPKLREQLELSGCRILEETKDRIVATCKPEVLEGGLKIERAKSIQTTRKPDEVTLILEKEKE